MNSKGIRIKIFIVTITMLFVILFTSGCWDAIDINEKQIVTSVVLDYKDEEIIFYIEIANIDVSSSGASGSSNDDKYIVVESKGKTLTEARDNFETKSNKPIYLSGVRAIIITENFAKKYLIEYLHRFRSDEDYRKKIDTVITREDPEELFKIAKERKESVGFVTEEIIKTLDEQGKSFKRTTMRLLENISTKYTGILVPCVGIREKDIAIVGYSVVHDNTVDGFLPAEDIEGMIFLKAKKPKMDYRIPYKDMNITLEVELKKRKIVPHYDNGQITFDVNMKYKALLLYGDKKEPYDFQIEDQSAVAEILRKKLKEELFDAVKRAQNEFSCDYYQFDDEFRVKYPIEFDRMNWEEEFPKIITNYNLKVSVSTEWMMDYSNNETK